MRGRQSTCWAPDEGVIDIFLAFLCLFVCLFLFCCCFVLFCFRCVNMQSIESVKGPSRHSSFSTKLKAIETDSF